MSTIDIHLDNLLAAHVAAIKESRGYVSASEYIRDLIRREMCRAEALRLKQLKAEVRRLARR